jgi:hypothetical protein
MLRANEINRKRISSFWHFAPGHGLAIDADSGAHCHIGATVAKEKRVVLFATEGIELGSPRILIGRLTCAVLLGFD